MRNQTDAKAVLPRGMFPGNRFRARARLVAAGILLLTAAKAAGAVGVTLTPASITQAATTTLQITGLTAGASAQVERWVDSNGNGAVDAGEPLAGVFRVTDGQWPSIGGVRDTNQTGDADSAANGQISVTLSPGTGVELGRVAGSQLLKVSSPTSAFTSLTRTLTVTQAAQAQTISGNVTNGVSPVPFASVIALMGNPGSDGEFVSGAVANASGAYSLSLPAGAYKLAVFKSGVVGGFGTSGVVTLAANASVTHHLTVVTTTRTITGKVSDSAGGAGLGAIQVFVASDSGLATIISTGLDGTYTAQVTADDWNLEFSSESFARLGYLVPASNGPDGFELNTSTVAGSATGQNASTDKATALFYGEVKGPGNTPVPGLWMGANDTTGRDAEAVTDANGRYAMGVLAGDWNLGVDGWSPALVGYVPPGWVSLTTTAGQATQQDFTLTAVNAQLAGTVTKNGSPVSGLRIGANNTDTYVYVSAETASDGTFDLGVTAGTWKLEVENDSAADFNVVGPAPEFTLAVNQTISGIAFMVLDATATISGTVRDENGQGVSQANVYAYTSIGGTTYVSGIQTDGNGQYSLLAVNGSWQVGVNADGFPNPDNVTVVVSGANVTRNLTLSRLPAMPFGPFDDDVSEGETLVFSINTSGAGDTYRWQVSTNGGSVWSNLSNDTTYSATDTHLLGVTASLALNGLRYRCVVTNTYGSTNSGSALLTVNAGGTPPNIENEPAAASTTAGMSATFEVTASGSPSPSYQWQLSTDNGFNWNNLANNAAHSGVTGPMLAVLSPTMAQNGHRYRVIATNASGSDTSAHAILTVTGTTPYELWLQTNFTPAQLANTAFSGPLATPADDGVPNLYKYAFNLTALNPGYGGTLTTPLLSGSNLVLVFPATRNELNYQVKASTDLLNWTATGVVTQVNGTLRTASYPAGSGRVFLRIFVTQP